MLYNLVSLPFLTDSVCSFSFLLINFPNATDSLLMSSSFLRRFSSAAALALLRVVGSRMPEMV